MNNINAIIEEDIKVSIEDKNKKFCLISSPSTKNLPNKKKLFRDVNVSVSDYIVSNNLSLRFRTENDDIVVEVCSDSLPGGSNKFYTVLNFDKSDIYRLLLSSDFSENKVVSGYNVFLDPKDCKEISFTKDGMKSYDYYMNNTLSTFCRKLVKKTKTVRAGHKYYTSSGIRIVLGVFKTHKVNPSKDDFSGYSDEANNNCYLYVNKVDQKFSCVSEVLENATFGDDDYSIKVSTETNVLSDQGEELVPLDKDIVDYFPRLIERYKESEIIYEGEGYLYGDCFYHYKNLYKLLDILAISEKENSILGTLLYDIIYSNVLYNYILYKDRGNVSLYSSGNDEFMSEVVFEKDSILFSEELELEKAFLYDILRGSGVYVYQEFYKRVLTDLYKINLGDIIKDVLNWNESIIEASFKDYLKYNFFYKFRNSHGKYKIIYDYKILKDKKSVLSEILCAMIEEVKSGELYLDSYSSTNDYYLKTGYYSVNIKLEDIVSRFGGVDNVPDLVCDEIMSLKINNIIIQDWIDI